MESNNVCNSQQDFNNAMSKALRNYNRVEMDKLTKSPIMTIYSVVSIVYLIFIIWAVFLAMKVEKREQRIIHLTLAFISGPAYVFAYYFALR